MFSTISLHSQTHQNYHRPSPPLAFKSELLTYCRRQFNEVRRFYKHTYISHKNPSVPSQNAAQKTIVCIRQNSYFHICIITLLKILFFEVLPNVGSPHSFVVHALPILILHYDIYIAFILYYYYLSALKFQNFLKNIFSFLEFLNQKLNLKIG